MNRIWHVVAITLCGTGAQAQDIDLLMTTPIRWKGVEVVSNDFASIEEIRSAAGFPEGSVMLMSDPRLKSTCAAVRAAFPSMTVTCSPLLGEGATNTPHAWYVIEVDIPKRRPVLCVDDTPALDEELKSQFEMWQTAMSQALLTGAPMREFVNDMHYLDYESQALSNLAKQIYMVVRDRATEIEAAATSCEPRERERAFSLMNFVGDPRRFIGLAVSHVLDEDAAASNAATRFLATFTDSIDAAMAPRLADVACSSLEGGLTARNKSLALLNKLKNRRTLEFGQLAAACQAQIRNIARTSRAELVAGPARELTATINSP